MNALNLSLTIGLPALASLAAAQNVIVDGRLVAFDVPPKMINGTLMVPARNLFEATGADMRWRMDRAVLESLRKGNRIEMWVGSRQARLNDRRWDLDQAPFEEHGRIYAPLSFLAAGMRYTISLEHGDYILRQTTR